MKNTLNRTLHLVSSHRQLIKCGVSTDLVDRQCAVLLDLSLLLLRVASMGGII
jgi:hypothetical protein